MMKEKQVVIKIKIDCEKDEFGNIIHYEGFENGKPIQNTIELVGLLETIKQQEIRKLFRPKIKKL